MSSISNRHQVVKFIAGETKAFSGQRLSHISYKSSKRQKAKFENHCVSVPVFETADIISAVSRGFFVSGIREFIENSQKDLIKALFEASSGLLSSVSDEEISLESVEKFLLAKNSDSAFGKDTISAWFDSHVKDNLTVILCDKFSTEDTEAEIIIKMLNLYKAVLCLAADKDFVPAEKQLTIFQNSLKFAEDYWVTKKMQGFLDSWIEKINAQKDLMEEISAL